MPDTYEIMRWAYDGGKLQDLPSSLTDDAVLHRAIGHLMEDRGWLRGGLLGRETHGDTYDRYEVHGLTAAGCAQFKHLREKRGIQDC